MALEGSRSDAVQAIPYRRRPKSEARLELEREIRELDPYLDLRQRLYETSWASCLATIENTLQESHNATLREVEHFVDHYDEKGSLYTQLMGNHSLLQTGLIVGTPSTASPVLYSKLCQKLSTAPGRVVTRISCRDCPNIKAAFRSVISGFTRGSSLEAARPVAKRTGVLAPDDFQNLLEWYVYKRQRGETPQLVLLMEDLELIDPKVVYALLNALLQYIGRMGFTLLVSIATTPDVLYRSLPQSIMARLDLSLFYIESNTTVLETVLERVFLNHVQPISLGPRAFEYLYRSFTDLHHSPDALISAIQYLYFHHFVTKPYTVVSNPYERGITSEVDFDTVKMIEDLPSFQKLEQTSPSFIQDYIDIVKECYQMRIDWERRRRQAYKLLVFTRDFWKLSNSTGTASLLLKLWDGTLVSTSIETCNSILHATCQRLYEFLLRLLQFIDAEEDYDNLRLALQRFYVKLQELGLDEDESGTLNLKNGNIPGSHLVNGAMSAKDKAYTKLSRDVSNVLIQYFSDSLPSHDTLPLHELWFSNDVAPVKRFSPSILSSVRKTLDSTSAAAGIYTPDIAVAYCLYKDAGRSINLADWWATFEQSMTPEDFGLEDRFRSRKRKRAQDLSEDELALERRNQARFIQALGDLAYLGLVQPHSRKKEHVQKVFF